MLVSTNKPFQAFQELGTFFAKLPSLSIPLYSITKTNHQNATYSKAFKALKSAQVCAKSTHCKAFT